MNGHVELLRLLNNLLRIGTIDAVDVQRWRVRFRDGDLLTDWRPWLEARAGTTLTWNPPTVGEQALLLSVGGDPADSVVLVGLFSDAYPPPQPSDAIHRTDYPDGAVVEYNHQTSHLQATLPGSASLTAQSDVDVTTQAKLTATAASDASISTQANLTATAAGQATVTAPQINLNGNLAADAGGAGSTADITASQVNIHGPLHVTGGIVSDGDVVGQGISLVNHVHGGVKSGGSETGAPQ